MTTTSVTPGSVTLRQSPDGSWEQSRAGYVWLLDIEHDSRHPGPCGHPSTSGCLTVKERIRPGVFWTKEAARRYMARVHDAKPDEWCDGDPDGSMDFLVRVWVDDAGQTTEQFMAYLSEIPLCDGA